MRVGCTRFGALRARRCWMRACGDGRLPRCASDAGPVPARVVGDRHRRPRSCARLLLQRAAAGVEAELVTGEPRVASLPRRALRFVLCTQAIEHVLDLPLASPRAAPRASARRHARDLDRQLGRPRLAVLNAPQSACRRPAYGRAAVVPPQRRVPAPLRSEMKGEFRGTAPRSTLIEAPNVRRRSAFTSPVPRGAVQYAATRTSSTRCCRRTRYGDKSCWVEARAGGARPLAARCRAPLP